MDTLNQSILEAQEGREETEERQILLEEVQVKSAQKAKNSSELEVFRDMDPDLFELKSKSQK